MWQLGDMHTHLRTTANRGLEEVPITDEELDALVCGVSYRVPTAAEWFPPLGGGTWEGSAEDNPFRQVAPAASQSSRLTLKDIRKLYEAMAFAMWRYKATMNAHVVIVWSMMSIEPRRGAELLGKYLQEAQKWAAVGLKSNKKRQRFRLGWKLHYLYVHENAPGRGFHTHILMNVEEHARDEFKIWSRQCLARLTKRNVPFDAFRLVPGCAKTEAEQIEQSWHWFRYITKEYDDEVDHFTQDGNDRWSIGPLREVLKLWSVRPALDIPPMPRCKASQSIGSGAQKAAGFNSRFWSGKNNEPYNEHFGGWELEQLKKSLQI